jgi:uncharacterized protein YqeY
MALLRERINNDLIQALKNKEDLKVQTLRLLSAVIHNREIEKRAKGEEGVLTDDEIAGLVIKEVKKRKEAIDLYLKGGRPELADKENAEIKILEAYLPAQMSEEEIRKALGPILDSIKPQGPKDFGRVMGVLMKELKGKADAELVGKIVREALGKDGV